MSYIREKILNKSEYRGFTIVENRLYDFSAYKNDELSLNRYITYAGILIRKITDQEIKVVSMDCSISWADREDVFYQESRIHFPYYEQVCKAIDKYYERLVDGMSPEERKEKIALLEKELRELKSKA
jgi:hypothetical protein